MKITIPDGKGGRTTLYGDSYALLIGNSDYNNGWPKLPGVKDDLMAIQTALMKQGFEVSIIIDATYDQLDKAFKDFISAHGLNSDNRLLFYYAGHGNTQRQSYGGDMGYIVPIDAPNPNIDKNGFLAKAMDMQVFDSYARRIQSKHALFVFDACFSGSIFALSRAIPENISYKTAAPVRQFLTSGSAFENVPDKSIFCQMFVAALQGEADVNHDGYVTGVELGEFLQEKVVNYSRDAQHPQYGKIRDPNLDKGDIVFESLDGGRENKPKDAIVVQAKEVNQPTQQKTDESKADPQLRKQNVQPLERNPVYVGIAAGYVSVRRNEGGGGPGGIAFAAKWNVGQIVKNIVFVPEIQYFSVSDGSNTFSDISSYLKADYFLKEEGAVRPFLGLGIGYNAIITKYSSPSIWGTSYGGSQSSTEFQIGLEVHVGVRFELSEALAFIVEPQYVLVKDFNHFVAKGGFALALR
jgi:hypothetical protein